MTTSLALRADPLLVRAEDAYQRVLAGFTRRGLRELRPLSGAIARDAPPEVRARLQLLAGKAFRLAGHASPAAEALKAAFVAFPADCVAERNEAALLLVENDIARGALPAARQLVVELADRMSAGARDCAHGLLHASAGAYVEGMALLRESAGTLTGDAQQWARLFHAEACMDAEKLELAGTALAALAEGTVARKNDELHMRWLAQRALLAAILHHGDLGGDSSKKGQSMADVKRAWRSARAHAINVPRYAAVADVCAAMGSAGARPARSLALMERALVALRKLPYRFDEARLGLLYEAKVARTHERTSAPLVARGRDILAKMGATARLTAGAGESGSIFRSMARSMMTTGAKGDDVELAAIFEVNKHIASSLKLDEVLQRILESVVRVLKAERGVILRPTGSEGGFTAAATRGIDPAAVRPDGGEISFSVVREAAKRGGAVLSDNAQLDERFRGQASVLASNIRSVLCAPIATAKGSYGFLYLDSSVLTRAFNEGHREAIEVVCTQAATAIENAQAFGEIEALTRDLEHRVEERTRELSQRSEELSKSLDELRTTKLALAEAERDAMRKELETARAIQVRLIPPEQTIERPGLRVFGRVRPAFYCAGDMWTIFSLSPTKTLLFVGDVTGHGAASSMVATAAKAAADAFLAMKRDLSLLEFVKSLDAAIGASGRGELLMTACICLIDTEQRTLECVSAGHEAPRVIDNSTGLAEIGTIAARGTRLGEPDRAMEIEQATLALVRGQRIVLYTDGLTECSDAKGRQFGQRRLKQALVPLAAETPERIVTSLIDGALTYSTGGQLDDDITVVCVEVCE
ncbi:MAG: SpoIIE family protein phosphatase [Deltaproteobacteria bacterium]|nr:SpoIIE family protein phosphatase [Deltaproteobacteria bacterium]